MCGKSFQRARKYNDGPVMIVCSQEQDIDTMQLFFVLTRLPVCFTSVFTSPCRAKVPYGICEYRDGVFLWMQRYTLLKNHYVLAVRSNSGNYSNFSSCSTKVQLSTSSPKLRTQAASSGSLLVVISSMTPPSSCSKSFWVSDQIRSRT